ncbi:DUF2791 family P-loop domain-containing protein [bacterium]|nr:DUF2791 family P-loop domain-containing protein [bacterium]
MTADNVRARAAIEGLRSGVPSRHAVAQLGTTQTEIKSAFDEAIEGLQAGAAVKPLVISANFGSGKTHLLEYLQALAEERNFAVSYLVVSPEMPLGSAPKVLQALSESSRAPGRIGKALRSLGSERARPEAFQEVRAWCSAVGLHERFLALLHLYCEFSSDPEFRAQILGDIEGKPLLRTVLNQKLKEIGTHGSYDLKGASSTAVLAPQRIRLFAQLIRACGVHGTVVLFDELERMAQFSKKQRLAAYEQLGWWAGLAARPGSGILPVFAMTSSFVNTCVLPDEASGILLALDERDRQAQEGVRLLKGNLRLIDPSQSEIESVRYRIKALYEEAYQLAVPDFRDDYYEGSTPIRQRIRRWITQWDLHRFFPDQKLQLVVDELRFDSNVISDQELAQDPDQDD